MAPLFEELRRIAYSAYVEDEGKLWISNTRHNGIYSVDRESGELCFHGRIPGYSEKERVLHSYAIKYRGDIFFLPWAGESIDCFCVEEETVSSFPLKCWNKENGYTVAGYFLDENKLLLVPKNLKNSIIYFSLETKECEEVVFEGVRGLVKNLTEKKDVFTLNVVSVENRIFFAIYETNYLVELNLIDGTEVIHEIPSESGLDIVGFDGEDFWLGQAEDVVRWNRSKGVLDTYKGVIGKCAYEKNIVTQFVPYNDSLYVIPQYFGSITKIDTRTKEMRALCDLPKDYRMICDGTERWRHLRNAYIRGNELIINPMAMNMELHINLFDDSVCGKEYLVHPIAVSGDWQVCSEKEASLEEFIKYKVLHRNLVSKRKEIKENVGRTIYEAIGDETIG